MLRIIPTWSTETYTIWELIQSTLYNIIVFKNNKLQPVAIKSQITLNKQGKKSYLHSNIPLSWLYTNVLWQTWNKSYLQHTVK